MADGQSLIEWADGQPEWARDALRRHATSSSFQLSEADKTAIAERVHHAAGMPCEIEPDHAPLSAVHLNLSAASSPRALLCSLGPVVNLERLASGQKLKKAAECRALVADGIDPIAMQRQVACPPLASSPMSCSLISGARGAARKHRRQ